MSSKKSPASKTGTVTKLAIFLGLGLGFSGELAGCTWIGWMVGEWWVSRGGPASAPGLTAGGFMMMALVHIIWLLWRLEAKVEKEGLDES